MGSATAKVAKPDKARIWILLEVSLKWLKGFSQAKNAWLRADF